MGAVMALRVWVAVVLSLASVLALGLALISEHASAFGLSGASLVIRTTMLEWHSCVPLPYLLSFLPRHA